VLSQQAARSQSAPQIQTPVQERSDKPPTLRQTTLPDAFVDVPFHASVQAADGYGDVVMTLRDALPGGLTMQSGARTLAISGVPEVSGTFDLEVTANDSKGQIARGSFTMRILPRPLSSPTPAVIPDAETIHTADADNVFFPAVIRDTETLHTADTDNDFFPSVIRDAEGIHTTDTANVFFPAVIKVAEGIKSTDADNSLPSAVITDAEAITTTDAHVIAAKVGILPSTAPSGTYNTAYSQAFTAAGNTGTVTLTTSGTLPAGLSFSGTGSSRTLSGTPTQTGTFPFSIKAQDTVNTSTVNYSLVINPTTQTINLGTLPSPTYGGSAFSLTGDLTASSGLTPSIALNSGPVTGSGFGPYTITGAGTASFTATQTGNTDYAAASAVNFNVSIAKATLGVAATSTSRAFDQPNPSFGYTFGSFVNGDTASVVSGTPTFFNLATPLSPVSGSPYSIGLQRGTLAAANYTFAFSLGATLTVTPAAQTVTFYPLPTLSNGMSFQLSARASSGLAVTYNVSGPASITNNVLSVTGSGLVTVTASQSGNGNYNSANSIVRSFTAP
jgi:hypothetical protein